MEQSSGLWKLASLAFIWSARSSTLALGVTRECLGEELTTLGVPRAAWLATSLLIAAIACADRSDARPTVDSPAVVRTPTRPSAKVSVPFYLDSAENCGLLRSPAFSDPVVLVQRFVTSDNRAEFLQSSALLDSVYACPQHLPGPDEFSVVRRSDVQLVTRNDSQATILVRSAQIGRMSQDSVGFVFIREPLAAVDTYTVVNTQFGWRILSPQLPGRVLDSIVFAREKEFRLRASVRESLAQARSRPDT